MSRRYDSTRRKQAAERTRRDILQAALKLHWEGITEIEPLAREAGCSVPTVRKHFPTKEDLFRNCTRTFGESLAMPDLAALGAIADPHRRFEECVSELCRIHEAMFGYAWASARLRHESAVLDEALTAYEGLADAVAGILLPADAPSRPAVRGFLDFLTYRALRLSGGLPPEGTLRQLIATLRPLVFSEESPSIP
jgi:AcrR family transcriptional regulator